MTQTWIRLWILTPLIFGSLSAASLGRLDAAPKSEVQVQAQALKMVSINKAGNEELQLVRGIGPALAERIIQYREEHGPFRKVEDLANVRGIGEAKFQKIKDQISI